MGMNNYKLNFTVHYTLNMRQLVKLRK